MKRASFMREQLFQSLSEELRGKLHDSSQSHVKASKWIQLFCMYLANYTSVKKIEEIDEDCILNYFDYLTTNFKRLSLTLTDIKRSMQLLEDALDIKIDQSLLDFSVSNTTLWNKLK
ncbi:swarming motility protein SwrAA [Metabacillus herbersteinensis]|uniref:Swarming motility protein SwrAA n=1 Tax=Metabacillus herbersteinensis TaxID=283816 RepID=A0ABV6GIL8_9BACI